MRAYRGLKFKYKSIISTFLAAIVFFLLRSQEAHLGPVLHTATLFDTLVHEIIGHAFIVWATGGRVIEVVINLDGSGHAMYSGGVRFLVIPAGYFASTGLMAIMFWINNRFRWGEVIPFLMGVGILLGSLFFGNRVTQGSLTTVAGVIFGSILIFITIHPTTPLPFSDKKLVFPDWLWMSIVNLITFYYAVQGFYYYTLIAKYSVIGDGNDISKFAELYLPNLEVSTVAWGFYFLSAFLWALAIFDVILSHSAASKDE